MDSAREKGLVQYCTNRRSLPWVAFEQQAQESTQVLRVMHRHGRVRTSDDVQHQILHVPGLELKNRKRARKTNKQNTV